MRILSVDFDYFVDASYEMRTLCFPDGNDNLNPLITKYIWDRCYEFNNDIGKVNVIPDYFKMCEILENSTCGKVLFADSHREIEKFFKCIRQNEDIEIINVDFHHDMYITGGSTLDCGNWLRFFKDINPDANVTWVRREDSDVESLDGEFPYRHTTDLSIVKGEFDLIFLCFSSPWSPPHLKPYFDAMCGSAEHLEYFE